MPGLANHHNNLANIVVGATGGSILLSGTSTSNLSIANDVDLRFGTGDFTIEWWQYQTDSNSFPRVFAMGTYPSTNIGVSIEGGTFYFWGTGAFSFGAVSVKNTWTHFAVTRSGTSLRVFKNGTQLGTTMTNGTNFNNTTNALRIGNETTTSTGASFGGYITNFHWITGTAKYTTNFTPSTTPLTATANTKLLLLATNAPEVVSDSSGLSKTVTNNSTTWNSKTPF